MKKLGIVLLLCITATCKSFACGGEFLEDQAYYNLFMQEMMTDERYRPFLLTLDARFYGGEEPTGLNENILEWADYLHLEYGDAYDLVFGAQRDDITKVLSGIPAKDPKLKFLTPAFVKKYKQALLYIAYAKQLEPYMRISDESGDNGWSYFPKVTKTASGLDYAKTLNVLQKSWLAETEDELKLRYGYQMVRLAHYTRHYKDAISYFNQYVDALNYRPWMYYWALSQKAGAERGAGLLIQANADFFQVFVESNNLKAQSLNSIRMTQENFDFNYFLQNASKMDETKDAYLLLGYMSFNNPLNALEKIAEFDPDASQSKVLMARAINQIERELMPNYEPYEAIAPNYKTLKDKRYPIIAGTKIETFFNQALAISQKMANTQMQTKAFWQMTTAYLYFLKKDFAGAKNILKQIDPSTLGVPYYEQKENLEYYIAICEQPTITDAFEQQLVEMNKNSRYMNLEGNFLADVLANRYFIQKEYAKSFLLSHKLEDLMLNPQLEMVDALEKFYQKPDKNLWEQQIAKATGIATESSSGADKNLIFLQQVRTMVYLMAGDLQKAMAADDKLPSNMGLPILMFGYNRIESFDSPAEDVMVVDYQEDFYLPKYVGFSAMNRLQKEGEKTGRGMDDLAAKANYLLGNLYYNMSFTGYYGNYSNFSNRQHHYFGQWYDAKPDIFGGIYFKYYKDYHTNTVGISQRYLEKAYKQASDPELKARIVFALSKCEQEIYYEKSKAELYGLMYDTPILIEHRKQFKELLKYRQTAFFDEVKTNCNYFDWYCTNFAN
ncbi:MAG: hypothetical protein LBN93_02970 [Candidatus Symbiothrix sp.]|jgi:hypothetical protein|nr:hypothetical protein [Candidatus Symbiothrix sp.]